MCVLLATTACGQDEPSITDPEDLTSPETLVAIGWVGLYEGWGTVTDADSVSSEVSDLTLRIAFDADSVRLPDCPHCVTVTLDPWFSLGNVRLQVGSEASLSYQVDSVSRTMTMFRFSASGSTANAVLVDVRHQTTGPSGPLTLLDADLEFRAR